MCRWKYGNYKLLQISYPYSRNNHPELLKLSELVIQQKSYRTESKSHTLSSSCINHLAAFYGSHVYTFVFRYRRDCSFFKPFHSKQKTKHDLHITEKQKTSQVKQLFPQSLPYKNSTRYWDSILSEHFRIESTGSHIHSNILHIIIKTFTTIWAPKIKSVTSVLSNITTLTMWFLALCFDFNIPVY